MLVKSEIRANPDVEETCSRLDVQSRPRYLLIGGTGFLGKHVCEAINRRGDVAMTVSRHPDTKFLKGHAPSVSALSVKNPTCDLLKKQIEVSTHVIFRAGPSDPSSMQSSGEVVNQSRALLKHVSERISVSNPQAHLVYISSGDQIYGKIPNFPVSERAGTVPITDYGREKLACEALLKKFLPTKV